VESPRTRSAAPGEGTRYRLLDAGLARALVCDPRRPHLLAVDGREHVDLSPDRLPGERRVDGLVQSVETTGEERRERLAQGMERSVASRHEELEALVVDAPQSVHPPAGLADRR
jgi:hypothetical protein